MMRRRAVLSFLGVVVCGGASGFFFPPSQTPRRRRCGLLLQVPRGGGQEKEEPPLKEEEEEEGGDREVDRTNSTTAKERSELASRWILEQIRRRQQRLAVLSESLAVRGLPFASVVKQAESLSRQRTTKAPQWVCAMSTEEDPKTCLIYGDAPPGTKVVRPRLAEGKWVSLAALNGLRRRDPVKASRLWFDQYYLDMRRFSHEAGTAGVWLGTFLESPPLFRAAVGVGCFAAFFVLRPFLLFFLVTLGTSNLLWQHYGLWANIVHAPLPLKLLIARQLYVAAGHYFGVLAKLVLNFLVDYESNLFEDTARALKQEPPPPPQGGGGNNNNGDHHHHHRSEKKGATDDDDDIMRLDPMDRIRLYAIDQLYSEEAKGAVRTWL